MFPTVWWIGLFSWIGPNSTISKKCLFVLFKNRTEMEWFQRFDQIDFFLAIGPNWTFWKKLVYPSFFNNGTEWKCFQRFEKIDFFHQLDLIGSFRINLFVRLFIIIRLNVNVSNCLMKSTFSSIGTNWTFPKKLVRWSFFNNRNEWKCFHRFN